MCCSMRASATARRFGERALATSILDGVGSGEESVPRSLEDLQVIYWKHDVLSVTWRQCDAHARHLGTTPSVSDL
jgi:hypothetical protein